MKYIQTIEDGYIVSIGTGTSGDEITEDRYNEIMSVIRSKPPRTETTDYRLKTDLTWESFEVEPEPEPEPTPEEILNILMGVEE